MMCINPKVYKKLPYDGLKEFVAWAKERKGKVNFASFGTGSSSHIWGEMLNQAESPDMTHVPYKGAGPAIQDMLAGHIPMTIQDLAASRPAISGGKLTPPAVTSTVRWPRQPNMPTFNEAGYQRSVWSAGTAFRRRPN